MSTPDSKQIIGSNTLITVGGVSAVPAKIDTGADSSSIWVSNIVVTDDTLHFTLFAPDSPYYTGEIISRTDYSATAVRSSNGQSEIRYRTQIPVVINDRKIKVSFTLSDRRRNHFPVLIGRRTLNGKFLVDVARSALPPRPKPLSAQLSAELNQNRHQFHQKYFKKGAKS